MSRRIIDFITAVLIISMGHINPDNVGAELFFTNIIAPGKNMSHFSYLSGIY